MRNKQRDRALKDKQSRKKSPQETENEQKGTNRQCGIMENRKMFKDGK